MDGFKFWGWDKKPRAMLRFVKSGDIFCCKLDDGRYGFWRIVAKVSVGNSAEIFDYFHPLPALMSLS